MERGIFEEYAPSYWAAGLQVIPLLKADKGTRLEKWTRWCSEVIPQELRDEWVETQPEGNIGICAGPASGVVFVDIDTPDQNLINALLAVLPPSPWRRFGRKGMVLAYRWTDALPKSFQAKDRQGGMLVEFLNVGRQVVAPPSIHPDTRQPYRADSDLWDATVLGALHTLPPGVEALLRGTLEEAGVQLSLSGHTRVTDWVSRGSRDVQMIAVAGHYVNGVLRGELTFQEAIQRVVAWHSSCVEKIAGDDIDVEKGVRRMGEFLIRDVMGPKQKPLPAGWDDGLSDAEKTAFGFDVFNAQNEIWDAGRIKEYLRAAFITHDPDSDARLQAIEAALGRIAQSRLDPMMEESLIRYIVQAGQLNVTVATVRAKVRMLRAGGIEGTDHNQVADAVLAELTDGGPIACTGGALWQWMGSHWNRLDEVDVLRKIAEGYGHLPAARKQNDHQGILKVLKTKVVRELKLTTRQGVNFANGYLTSDLELVDHHPDDGCTYTLPYRWLPELADVAKARRFSAFLDDSWADDADYAAKVRALQEAMAITLFGVAPQFERVFCLHGPPASGKSQMLRIVNALVPGEVTCAVPPNDWGDKFLPAELHGKLLNICGELPEKRLIDGQRFKEIVSGEVVTAQRKHQQPFKFRPSCAHWFATNHIPRTNDMSAAFNRRWLILTYEKPVAPEKRVLDLGVLIVAEEREAIAAWAVEAMRGLVKTGQLTIPRSHEERIGEIARANNSLRWFLLDSGRVLRLYDATGSTPASVSEQALYDAYFSFAFSLGAVKPVTLSGFRHAMRELGSEIGFRVEVRTERTGAQTCNYLGLTLASSARGRSAA